MSAPPTDNAHPLNVGAHLIVTTALSAGPDMTARSQAVAAHLGARWVGRDRGITALLRRHDARLAYVVTAQRESLQDGNSALFMHPGLFYLKHAGGSDHPLLRAIASETGPPVTHLIDGTLGLAGDALHIADMLGAQVEGIEASPVVACLTQEGLLRVAKQRKRWARAAGLISVTSGDTATVLAGRPNDSVDVVYLDPMFRTPLGAPPGWALFRQVADHRRPGKPLLREAVRVARQRVVVKVAGKAPPPLADAPAPGFNRWVRGRALDYHIIEKS